jgi:type IV secretory pathway protease TraF
MFETRVIDYSEQRRAIRIPWERPVRITQPLQIPGRTVNVSAVGLLMRVDAGYPLTKGDFVAVEIPRADGSASLVRRGRITRVEPAGKEIYLGLELV